MQFAGDYQATYFSGSASLDALFRLVLLLLLYDGRDELLQPLSSPFWSGHMVTVQTWQRFLTNLLVKKSSRT